MHSYFPCFENNLILIIVSVFSNRCCLLLYTRYKGAFTVLFLHFRLLNRFISIPSQISFYIAQSMHKKTKQISSIQKSRTFHLYIHLHERFISRETFNLVLRQSSCASNHGRQRSVWSTEVSNTRFRIKPGLIDDGVHWNNLIWGPQINLNWWKAAELCWLGLRRPK